MSIITDNERKMMENILYSEYHNAPEADRHGWHNGAVWFDNPFRDVKTCGGVCASLSKKGWAEFEDDGHDGEGGRETRTMCLTKAGLDLILGIIKQEKAGRDNG